MTMGAVYWTCAHCGSCVKSIDHPNTSSSGGLTMALPFRIKYEDPTPADCDEALVKRIMES